MSRVEEFFSARRIRVGGEAEDGGRKSLEKTRNSVRRSIALTRQQLDRLSDLVEQGIYPPGRYRERSEALGRRLSELEASEREVLEKLSSADSQNADAAAEISPSGLYRACAPGGRNRLLRAMIEGIEYYKAKDWKPGQFELLIRWKGVL